MSNELIIHSWLDRSAIGRPNAHDERFSYNPPAIIAPAMDQSQFDYDNQKEVEANFLANPSIAAHVIMELRDRILELERRLNDDNRSEG